MIAKEPKGVDIINLSCIISVLLGNAGHRGFLD